MHLRLQPHAGGNPSTYQTLAQNTINLTRPQMSTHSQLPPHAGGRRAPPPLLHVQNYGLDYTEGGRFNSGLINSASDSEQAEHSVPIPGHSRSTPGSQALSKYNTLDSPSKYATIEGPGNNLGHDAGEREWCSWDIDDIIAELEAKMAQGHPPLWVLPALSTSDSEIGIQILKTYSL
jgi:hypothetical protein